MNPKRTWLWLAAVAVMLGAILIYQRFAPKPNLGPVFVLPGLKPQNVASVQVQPAGQKTIRVERTDDGWQLTQPFSYRAQAESVNHLLDLLEKLTPALRMTPAELKLQPAANDEFGFNPPQTQLVIEQGASLNRLAIGNKTAPGGGVYVKVVGSDDIYVVDGELLKRIPQSDKDWRDTQLVDWTHLRFDHLIATNGGKILELQSNVVSGLWRLVRPTDTRADRDRIDSSLRQLRSLRVQHFETDDPHADLDPFGLQNPELSVSLLQGTNTVLLLEFGRSPTNKPGLIYARRDNQGTIVQVERELVEPWRASHDFRDFFDRHMVSFTDPIDTIKVFARDNFTVQRQSNDTWRVLAPFDLPADPLLVGALIGVFTNMEVQIQKLTVAEPALSDYNLATPTRRYVFEAASTNAAGDPTNSIIAELHFGIIETNVYTRRVGESIVYLLKPEDFQLLPYLGVHMRDRRIWNFDESDVASVVIQTNGKVREIVHTGTNKWTLGPKSVGMINPLAVEEVVHQLGELSAAQWVERGDRNRAQYGFTTNGFKISIELKTGKKLEVEFGALQPPGLPFAATLVDGEPWIFLFPWPLYHEYVWPYLSIPAYVP